MPSLYVHPMYPNPSSPCPHTQSASIRPLEKLSTMYRYSHRINVIMGSRFKGYDMQDWAKEHDNEWRVHLLYNLRAAGVIERKNGILNQHIELLTGKVTLAGWTKCIPGFNTFE